MNFLEKRIQLSNEVYQTLTQAIQEKKSLTIGCQLGRWTPIISTCETRISSNSEVMKVALAFFKEHIAFLKEPISLLKKLIIHLNIKDKVLIEEIEKLAKTCIGNPVILICEEDLIFTNTSPLLMAHYFNTAVTTPVGTAKDIKEIDPILRTFDLKQFSNELVNLSLEYSSNPTVLESILTIEELYKVYVFSDFLQYDALGKASVKQIVKKLLSLDLYTNLKRICDLIDISSLEELHTTLYSIVDENNNYEFSNDLDQKYNHDLILFLRSITIFDLPFLLYNLPNALYCPLELKEKCLKKIATAILNEGFELSFPITDKIQDIEFFSSEIITNLLKALIKKNLRLFFELNKNSSFNNFKEIFENIKGNYVPIERSIHSRDGTQVRLISDLECNKTFQCFPDDRINTPHHGRGTVSGISEKEISNRSQKILWIHLDKDPGPSYWSQFKSHEGMKRAGLKISHGKIKSSSGDEIELLHYSACFDQFGVFPGDEIETQHSKGIVIGVCEKGNLWVNFENLGVMYLSSVHTHQDFETNKITLPLKHVETKLKGSEAQLFLLLRILKASQHIKKFNI